MSKKVIIIGGSSGLGLDIAKIFGKNNNQIVLISSMKVINFCNKKLNNQNISLIILNVIYQLKMK